MRVKILSWDLSKGRLSLSMKFVTQPTVGQAQSLSSEPPEVRAPVSKASPAPPAPSTPPVPSPATIPVAHFDESWSDEPFDHRASVPSEVSTPLVKEVTVAATPRVMRVASGEGATEKLAIRDAARTLRLSPEQVKLTRVVQTPKAGLFGRLKGNFVVEVREV